MEDKLLENTDAEISPGVLILSLNTNTGLRKTRRLPRNVFIEFKTDFGLRVKI
jgi:hypothetical protein